MFQCNVQVATNTDKSLNFTTFGQNPAAFRYVQSATAADDATVWSDVWADGRRLRHESVRRRRHVGHATRPATRYEHATSAGNESVRFLKVIPIFIPLFREKFSLRILGIIRESERKVLICD